MTNRSERAPLLPAELSPSGFTVADALAAGISRGRLRNRALSAPRRGMRTLGIPDTELDRVIAVGSSLSPRQAFSGRSSAAVWGLPLPNRALQDCAPEIAIRNGQNAAGGRGVRGRRIGGARWSTMEVDGLSVLDPASTWASLARCLPVSDLVVVGDALVAVADNYPHRRFAGPLASIDDLADRADRWRRTPRGKQLGEALTLVRAGVESPMETLLRLAIVQAGLPEPEINVRVTVTDGTDYRLDLAYPSKMLGIEYDGAGHGETPAFTRDIERHEALRDAGWHMIRVTAASLGVRTDVTLDRIRRALAGTRS